MGQRASGLMTFMIHVLCLHTVYNFVTLLKSQNDLRLYFECLIMIIFN